MKKFLSLALLFCLQLAPATAMPAGEAATAGIAIAHPFDCTVSAKVYVLTDAGLIGVGLSVTAGSCSEAIQGIRLAITGFLKAL